MRLTYSGEFLHAAPWSVGSQGYANVSHGCTGMSTANAQWLYDLATSATSSRSPARAARRTSATASPSGTRTGTQWLADSQTGPGDDRGGPGDARGRRPAALTAPDGLGAADGPADAATGVQQASYAALRPREPYAPPGPRGDVRGPSGRRGHDRRGVRRDPAWAFMLGADYDRVAPLIAGALFDQRVERRHGVGGARMRPRSRCGTRRALRIRRRGATGRGRRSTRPRAPRCEARLAALRRGPRGRAAPAEPLLVPGRAGHPIRDRWPGAAWPRRVMRPGLARADAAGLACCLETSTAGRTATFYARRGFTRSTEVPIDGGPPTWWLTRPAQG